MELAGKLRAGDTVYLAAGIYQEPVTLTDSGTASNPIVIRNAENQEPIIKDTTWRLEGASHVVLEGLTFEDCSPAILFAKGASDNVVRNNHFKNCPPRGRGNYERAILGAGPDSHRNRIENNIIKRPYEPRGNEGPEGLNVTEGNRHWVICGNRISGYMYGLQLGVGSRAAPPAYIVVEGNEIFDCHEGVHIKTADNLIQGNYIHDLQRVGWMMAGCGVFLRSSPRTTVENNRIERAQGSGIRVLGNNHVIRNNLIVETPIGVWFSNHGYGRAGHSVWLVHNTVVDAMLPLWVAVGEALVFNNIFVAASGAETALFVAGCGENPMQTLMPDWYKNYAGDEDPEAKLIADFNLFCGVELPSGRYPKFPPEHERIDNSWWGAHNLQGTPKFVRPAEGDYSLCSDSPARGTGRWLPNCPFDFNGHLRPPAQPDIGAFQT